MFDKANQYTSIQGLPIEYACNTCIESSVIGFCLSDDFHGALSWSPTDGACGKELAKEGAQLCLPIIGEGTYDL